MSSFHIQSHIWIWIEYSADGLGMSPCSLASKLLKHLRDPFWPPWIEPHCIYYINFADYTCENSHLQLFVYCCKPFNLKFTTANHIRIRPSRPFKVFQKLYILYTMNEWTCMPRAIIIKTTPCSNLQYIVLHVIVLYVTLTQMYQHIHWTDMLVRFGTLAGH